MQALSLRPNWLPKLPWAVKVEGNLHQNRHTLLAPLPLCHHQDHSRNKMTREHRRRYVPCTVTWATRIGTRDDMTTLSLSLGQQPVHPWDDIGSIYGTTSGLFLGQQQVCP